MGCQVPKKKNSVSPQKFKKKASYSLEKGTCGNEKCDLRPGGGQWSGLKKLRGLTGEGKERFDFAGDRDSQ